MPPRSLGSRTLAITLLLGALWGADAIVLASTRIEPDRLAHPVAGAEVLRLTDRLEYLAGHPVATRSRTSAVWESRLSSAPPAAPRPVVAPQRPKPKPVVAPLPKPRRTAVATSRATRPPAPTTRKVAVRETPQQRGQRALRLISYPWRDLGYTIEFEGPADGYLGMTCNACRAIVIYVRDGQSDIQLAATIAHEIGHAVDHLYGDEQRRRDWLYMRGVSEDTPWEACNGCSDYHVGAGDFAEVFALWQIYDRAGFRSKVAGPPPRAYLDDELAPFFWPEGPSWSSGQANSG